MIGKNETELLNFEEYNKCQVSTDYVMQRYKK